MKKIEITGIQKEERMAQINNILSNYEENKDSLVVFIVKEDQDAQQLQAVTSVSPFHLGMLIDGVTELGASTLNQLSESEPLLAAMIAKNLSKKRSEEDESDFGCEDCNPF